MAAGPSQLGWVEAWSRAKGDADVLVVRNMIPAGRKFVVFNQVMSSHPFRELKSAFEDAGKVETCADDLDDIFVAESALVNIEPHPAHQRGE